MVNVWLIKFEKPYYSVLLETLRRNDEISLKELTVEKFLDSFNKSILNKSPLSIIISTESTKAVKMIKQIAGLCLPSDLSHIKFVALSTLLSWAASSRTTNFELSEKCFLSRKPVGAAFDVHSVENCFFELAKKKKLNLCIIGVGLVYGDYGFDFKDFLWQVWNKGQENVKTSIPLLNPLSKTNTAPKIHYKSLINLITNETDLISSSGDIFIPAVENTSLPLFEELCQLEERVNGLKTESETESGFERVKVSEGGQEQLISICEDPSVLLWAADLPSKQVEEDEKIESFFIREMEGIWHDFLMKNRLNPISIFIMGPPKSGKTEIAKQLSSTTNIHVIDLHSSIIFFLSLSLKSMQLPQSPLILQRLPKLEELKVFRKELLLLLEAKVNEGKKGKDKDKTPRPDSDEPGWSEDQITPAFYQSLPVETARKCIALQIELDPKCRRKGYILDVWDYRVVTGMESLLALCTCFPAPPVAEKSETPTVEGEAKVVEENIEAEVKEIMHTEQSVFEDYTKIMTHISDYIVEIQCSGKEITDRLLESLGAQTKSKESQAALKALETALAAYKDQLKPIPDFEEKEKDAENEGKDLTYLSLTHKDILTISDYSTSFGTVKSINLLRLNGGNGNTSESLSTFAVDSILQDRGCIGWLPHLFPSEKKPIDGIEKPVEKVEAEGILNNEVTGTGEEKMEDKIEEVMKPRGRERDSEKPGPVELTASQKASLSERTKKLQAFLVDTVLPHVAEGMVRIHREQPSDPIAFLSHLLLEHSQENRTKAEEYAKQQFDELLQSWI